MRGGRGLGGALSTTNGVPLMITSGLPAGTWTWSPGSPMTRLTLVAETLTPQLAAWEAVIRYSMMSPRAMGSLE